LAPHSFRVLEHIAKRFDRLEAFQFFLSHMGKNRKLGTVNRQKGTLTDSGI